MNAGQARRRRLALVGGLVALLAAWGNAAAQLAPLYVVPTEDRRQAAAASDEPLLLEFEAVDRARLLAVLGPGATAVDATRVRYAVDAATSRPYVAAGDDARWLAASFIVDHDQPTVAALHDAFLATAPADPAQRRAALVQFVAQTLEARPGRGLEPASVTARVRSGDCTEHAVLTAALARSLGWPARVAVGMAVLRLDGRYATMGHAWAEVREGERWVRADAALADDAEQTRYVPLGLLEDEGPGFLVGLIDTLNAWVTRVTVLAPNP